MSITSTTSTTTNTASTTATAGTTTNPNGVLGKDAFMQLLLVELQHQDPTAPTDTSKILTQTSQLAALESTDKTNKALADLATSLSSSQDFSTIGAIGKTADLGSDKVKHNKGASTSFEVYFPKDIQQGTVKIADSQGNNVANIDVGTNPSGVYSFTWDGLDASGNAADGGIYSINADYTDKNGASQKTRLGAYPIESVRFENGKTLVKLGSKYVPLKNIVEVY